MVKIKNRYPPDEWWTKNGLPVPLAEFKFHPKRKWRFDYYFAEYGVAIEIEGGAFTRGRHNRATGFIKDMEKYNAAVEMKIFILRYPSLNKIDIEQVKRVLEL